MTTFIHRFNSCKMYCVDHVQYLSILDLKQDLFNQKGVPDDAFFFICNGKLVGDDEPVLPNNVYHTCPRLPGGKGGFGSMLRAIGAQIEKTTNHEACRDLSGRRMRDINNEKDLKDWLAKQAEREQEKEERRQARIARRRASPNHKFDDPTYDQQRNLLAENQEDALMKGLQKTGLKPGTSATVTSEEEASSKRKCEADSSSTGKKIKKDVEWLGIDIDNLSDLDSDDSDDDKTEMAEADTSATPGEASNDSDSQSSEDRICTESSKVTSNTDNSSEVSTTVNGSSKQKSQDHSISSTATQSEDVQMSQSDQHEHHSDTSGNNNMDSTEKAIKDSEENQEDMQFNLDEITSAKEMEKFGLDRLKAELMSRGLKCGGTLEQRAERLFSIKGLTTEQIDPALFAKSNGKNVKNKKK